MFSLKYALVALIPDTPRDVTIQLARNEFLVSKVWNQEVAVPANHDSRSRLGYRTYIRTDVRISWRIEMGMAWQGSSQR